MFEKAFIRRAGDREIDIGMIAEVILFYGNTHLLLNRGVIHELTKIPCDDLLELSSRGCLNLSYDKSTYGVLSAGIIRVHSFVAFTTGTKERKRIPTFQEELSDQFIRAYGNSHSTRKAAKQFIDRVKLFRYPDSNNKTNIVCELAKTDIGDADFVRATVITSLQRVAPSYIIPKGFRFEIIDTGDGYAGGTDLDFAAITKVCAPPFNEGFTAAHLLGFILEARADTFFAANYMAELITTELSSSIIRLKHYDWLRRSDTSRKEIELFTEIASDKFPSIRETITSGNRSIKDFLKLLDRADKFKSWLQTANPDQGLVNAYLQEATKGSWADKLPTKVVRIAALTIAGLTTEAIMPTGLAIAATTALSAGDALLLDRIATGWRPAHFISGSYRRFVDPNAR